jgi:hypothetical protein
MDETEQSLWAQAITSAFDIADKLELTGHDELAGLMMEMAGLSEQRAIELGPWMAAIEGALARAEVRDGSE